jgi:hypothetical protein
LQFGLPTLLGLVTVLAIFLIVIPAERQRRAVAALRNIGAFVRYEGEEGAFSTPPPSWFRRKLGDDYLSNVISVNLRDSGVSDAELVHLEAIIDLQWLDLSDTAISNGGLAHLKTLDRLRYLNLSLTQIDDAGLEHLKGLTDLRWLYIQQTRVTDDGLTHLKGLPALKTVVLWGTRVTPAGVATLRNAMPGCQFIDTPSKYEYVENE